jgi:hypothetical protein
MAASAMLAGAEWPEMSPRPQSAARNSPAHLHLIGCQGKASAENMALFHVSNKFAEVGHFQSPLLAAF